MSEDKGDPAGQSEQGPARGWKSGRRLHIWFGDYTSCRNEAINKTGAHLDEFPGGWQSPVDLLVQG